MKQNRKRSGTKSCAVATEIVRHLFGKCPKEIKRVTGGLTNDVFEAQVSRESIIIRMSSDPAKLDVFRKEQWAIARAHKRGVPTAEVLQVGNEVEGVPYMIARKTPGKPATGTRDKAALLHALGNYARIINSIPTSDFGHVFQWSDNQLLRNRSLTDYFKNELKVDERLEVFRRSGTLDAPRIKMLRRRLHEMAQWKGKPSLNHGDLRLKNIIVNERREIVAILDWEHCTSNFAPFWELSIALHDLTMDEKEMFLEGYGLNLRTFYDMSPWIKALNILNYARAVSDAFDRTDKKQLLSLHTRLSGAFDLYSL
jgi:aminoglycoside phosphotransferase (APT) family kinase protein